ncbi:hypothetical protein Godav_019294 [Gossypium davidsonii]|uniref:Uncharacterized protein n=1 Tax=Gossypium davidsonii TaxID=34287 RepID=A0A7J8R020_GOSDV|nr:hypothetical protein [Gossypium davidsonii]
MAEEDDEGDEREDEGGRKEDGGEGDEGTSREDMWVSPGGIDGLVFQNMVFLIETRNGDGMAILQSQTEILSFAALDPIDSLTDLDPDLGLGESKGPSRVFPLFQPPQTAVPAPEIGGRCGGR